jgi:hypothetical protein
MTIYGLFNMTKTWKIALAKGLNSKMKNQHSIYFSFLTKDHNWPTLACLCLMIQINVLDISMNEILLVNELEDKKMFSLTCQSQCH